MLQQQTELFSDSGAVEAENDLLAALASRDWAIAARAYAELLEKAPSNMALASYDSLIQYGCHIDAHPDILPVDLEKEMTAAQDIEPLANMTLRAHAHARDYLSPAWQRLAKGLHGIIAFDPQQPDYHASYVLAKISDWQGVIDCLRTDSGLLGQPELLLRLAVALHHQQLPEQALLIWCVLFERHACKAEQLISEAKFPAVQELWQQFLSLDEEPGIEHFSGWILLKRPGLFHCLSENDPKLMPQSTTFKAMQNLLQARRGNVDEIEARIALQQQCPALLLHYLQIIGKAK
ncbi:hypothetical protein [Allohahella marinimesophila]|uniref:Uncharacterized protein n=1 Tax=Allohahella marinimesophila TaxID=1054972 RepID=A0ABP7Q731_9GAMM